ncbi:MAG: EAL domain-containing protein, partial [bacterium]|nr:EAL domain-containing protein [bacterium]
VQAIITLARNLHMKVTAEGVETDEQLALMLALDCDYAQGYHFSRPVDPAKATELLASPASWLESV